MSFIYPVASAFALAGPDAFHCNDALAASTSSSSPLSAYHSRPTAQTRRSTTKSLVGLGIGWPSEPPAPRPNRVFAGVGLGLGIDCNESAGALTPTMQARRPLHFIVNLLQERVKARTTIARVGLSFGLPLDLNAARESVRRSSSSSPSYDSSAFSAPIQSDGSVTSTSSYPSSTGKRSPSPSSDIIYVASPTPAAPGTSGLLALHTFAGRPPAFFTPHSRSREFAPFDYDHASDDGYPNFQSSAAGQCHNMEIMNDADSNVDEGDSPILHYYLPSDLFSPDL